MDRWPRSDAGTRAVKTGMRMMKWTHLTMTHLTMSVRTTTISAGSGFSEQAEIRQVMLYTIEHYLLLT